jgi:hypothetical protein
VSHQIFQSLLRCLHLSRGCQAEHINNSRCASVDRCREVGVGTAATYPPSSANFTL